MWSALEDNAYVDASERLCIDKIGNFSSNKILKCVVISATPVVVVKTTSTVHAQTTQSQCHHGERAHDGMSSDRSCFTERRLVWDLCRTFTSQLRMEMPKHVCGKVSGCRIYTVQREPPGTFTFLASTDRNPAHMALNFSAHVSFSSRPVKGIDNFIAVRL